MTKKTKKSGSKYASMTFGELTKERRRLLDQAQAGKMDNTGRFEVMDLNVAMISHPTVMADPFGLGASIHAWIGELQEAWGLQ